MRLLSASVFLLEKSTSGGVPTYEVKTLREALRSEYWDTYLGTAAGDRLARPN